MSEEVALFKRRMRLASRILEDPDFFDRVWDLLHPFEKLTNDQDLIELLKAYKLETLEDLSRYSPAEFVMLEGSSFALLDRLCKSRKDLRDPIIRNFFAEESKWLKKGPKLSVAGLSTLVYNCLTKYLNIRYLCEVEHLTDEVLLDLPYFGKKCLEELTKKMAENNLVIGRLVL